MTADKLPFGNTLSHRVERNSVQAALRTPHLTETAMRRFSLIAQHRLSIWMLRILRTHPKNTDASRRRAAPQILAFRTHGELHKSVADSPCYFCVVGNPDISTRLPETSGLPVIRPAQA